MPPNGTYAYPIRFSLDDNDIPFTGSIKPKNIKFIKVSSLNEIQSLTTNNTEMKTIEIEVPEGHKAETTQTDSGVVVKFVKEKTKDLWWYMEKFAHQTGTCYPNFHVPIEDVLEKYTPGQCFDIFLMIRDDLGGKPNLKKDIPGYEIYWSRLNEKYEVICYYIGISSLATVSGSSIAQKIIEICGTEFLDKIFKS